MIELTKLNGETILVNVFQIEYIEPIPESKIVMMNGRFHIVAETKDEVNQKILAFVRSAFIGSKLEV